MKERIYTIPLTQALDSQCECVLCEIERETDGKITQYFMGPAMMEPDTRTLINEKGFCKKHYDKMLETDGKLSLALTLQTRLAEIHKRLLQVSEIKKRRLKEKASLEYSSMFSSCSACEKIEQRMSDCIDNFVYLLSKEPDFRNKFLASKGLCMKHFVRVLPLVPENLADRITALQLCEIKRMNDEIDKFCLKFDYRSTDLNIDDVKDSPSRAAAKISS